jgi:hypothetical protein
VQRPIVLIGGCTGNGKTQLVCSRPDGIDLEGSPTIAARRSAAPCVNSMPRQRLKTTWRWQC